MSGGYGIGLHGWTAGIRNATALVALAFAIGLVAVQPAQAAHRSHGLQAKPIAAPPAYNMIGSLGRRGVFVEGRIVQPRGSGPSIGPRPRLWVTDGSPNGTKRILKLDKGARILGDYDPYEPGGDSKRLVFAADDGIHGREWWTTDGTAEGTHILLDAMPGPTSSVDTNDQPIELREGVVVIAVKDPEHGREWWRTDGTTEGTQLIEDIYPGSRSSHFGDAQDALLAGGLLYFTAMENTDEEYGAHLWRTDGTPGGTFSLGVRMGQSGLRGGELGDGLVFGDWTGELTPPFHLEGMELWETDGTPEGTKPYYDFPEEPLSAPVGWFGETEGPLFISRGHGLWVIDDVAHPPRKLHEWPGGVGLDGRGLNQGGFGDAAGSALFFDVTYKAQGSGHGVGPWVSLGTRETTVPLSSVVPGGDPGDLTATGKQVLLSSVRHHRAVLRSTTGPRRSLRRIHIRRGITRLEVSNPVEANGRAYFIGESARTKKRSFRLWKINRRR